MSAQVKRLISIAHSLSSCEKGMTVLQIANLYSISQKTARRDLGCLRAMGCQLTETVTAKGKKFYKLGAAPTVSLRLAFDEALALFIGCHTSPAYRDLSLGRAAGSSLHKLRLALGVRESQFIEAQLPRFYRTSIGSHYAHQAEWLDQLQLAIEDRQVVSLSYRSAGRTEPATYKIHPYGLVEHRGTLYMVGYSMARASMRTWKLDRVVGVERVDQKFVAPEDFDLKNYMQDAFAIVRGEKLQRVVIRLQPEASRYACEKQMHPSQFNEMHADGTATIQFELSSLLEIKSWIMSFGSQAEVLEPLQLREQIASEIKELAALYQANERLPTQRRKLAPK